jgi:hypothetical protein
VKVALAAAGRSLRSLPLVKHHSSQEIQVLSLFLLPFDVSPLEKRMNPSRSFSKIVSKIRNGL